VSKVARGLTIFTKQLSRAPLAPGQPGGSRGLVARFPLGIDFNIISRDAVRRNLEAYGVAHYFGPVITSSNRWAERKLNLRIFEEAVRLMELRPLYALTWEIPYPRRDGERGVRLWIGDSNQSFLTT